MAIAAALLPVKCETDFSGGSMSYDTTGSMVGATVGDPSDERWNALIDETDLVKGASLIGRSAMVLASLADLPDVPQSYTHEYIVQGHRPGITTGGGRFYWDGAVARNRHNGGTIISPLFLRTLPRRGWLAIWMARGKLSRPPLAALSAKSKVMVFASNGSAGCRGNSLPRQRKSFCNKPVRTKALRPTSVTRPCFPRRPFAPVHWLSVRTRSSPEPAGLSFSRSPVR